MNRQQLADLILNELPAGVKIDVQHTQTGITVNAKKTRKEIIKEKYSSLIGQPITITDAAKKYELHRDTIIEWKKRGYVTVIKPGYRMTLDEADVAYCADAFHNRKGKTGMPLLDKNGLPYELKHPGLSVYRRRKKHTKE